MVGERMAHRPEGRTQQRMEEEEMRTDTERVHAPPDAAGKRLDVWLAECRGEFSRSRWQDWIRRGLVQIDGRGVKPGAILTGGERIDFHRPPPEPAALQPEDIPLVVLYEDADLIAVDKPPGLVVHPAPGHAGGTLVNALLHHCGDLTGIGGERRPGIVHRLDKDTSGAMVAAKTEAAMAGLAAQFKNRTARKTYLAIVRGHIEPRAGRIETLIDRHPRNRKAMAVRTDRGRRAITRYEVEQSLEDADLVRLLIDTGRTHQIRVHMAHLGHPVLGDPVYGRNRPDDSMRAPRQMLHSLCLHIEHPTRGGELEFHAPLPADMRQLLKAG
jgi:23S rRNA pseudouridine1911/1915/1917 synthase